MNLLKVLVLFCLAASLSLLIPVASHAYDHPWDDYNPDTTRLSDAANTVKTDGADNAPRPFIDTPIIQRISDWVRGRLREVHHLFFSARDKQVAKGTVVERNKRPETPVVYRKHE